MSNNSNSKTNIAELLGDLNAGVFEEQINTALSDIAANVCTHGKKGELTIKFKLQQIGEGSQVAVTHSIKSVVPKSRGKVTEEMATDTPLHVERGGRLTLYPTTQTKMELGAGAATGRTDGVRA
ncbi:hypothetical protein [Dokdonella soli]|uniref:HU domain-containing protein n=1 Tax=Dokdonella soli TaxID=529810 RepID=A0ABN1IUG6_9GAMM